MNRQERTRKILLFLSKRPLSTTREISDNAFQTRINYNVIKNALARLVNENKIDKLFGHYYKTPTVKQEIPLLLKITRDDTILKPKFRKLSYENATKTGSFQRILELYILLVHMCIKINKIKTRRVGKPYFSAVGIKQVRKDLAKYLRSFNARKNPKVDDFHSCLIKYVDDEYFKDSKHFYDLMYRSWPLAEKARILSTYFRHYSFREISDVFSYKTNKIPRQIIDSWFLDNGNIQLAEIYAGLATGQIKNSEASDLFLQWHAYIGLTKRAHNGRDFTDKELKQYRKNFMKEYKKLYKIDVKKVVDVRAYGIS